ESQSQQGSPGSGWTLDRGLRSRSGEQSLPDLEQDVLGELLPASGAGGGDPKTAGRGENSRLAHNPGQNRPNRGGHGAGETGGTDIPPGLLWPPAEAVGAGCGGDLPETLLAVRLDC